MPDRPEGPSPDNVGPSGGVTNHACPARTPFSTRSPRCLSTVRRYTKARCMTCSLTPLSRWPTMLPTSRSRAASLSTSHECAGLAPVVVVRAQRVCGAPHVPVGVPAHLRHRRGPPGDRRKSWARTRNPRRCAFASPRLWSSCAPRTAASSRGSVCSSPRAGPGAHRRRRTPGPAGPTSCLPRAAGSPRAATPWSDRTGSTGRCWPLRTA
jgi:hypothetical protein